MNFFVIGTNYNYSPLEVREKLSYSRRRLIQAYALLREDQLLRKIVILSTCNRTEFYLSTDSLELAEKRLIDFICQFHGVAEKTAYSYFYKYSNETALRHLLEVTCGLDSLIVGELQILGQVKSAYLAAKEEKSVNKTLKDIFSAALSTAKEVHSKTRVSQGKVSVGSVAVEFIKGRLGSLTDKRILLVGVGKVTELVLKYLKRAKASVIFVSNRTYDKAKVLAEKIAASAVPFDDLKQNLAEADIVITATASKHFIINKDTIESSFKNRSDRIAKSLLILDLALPRDVNPEIKQIEDIELFCLEDLDAVIQSNRQKKAQAAKKAQILINREAENLWKKYTESAQEPALLP